MKEEHSMPRNTGNFRLAIEVDGTTITPVTSLRDKGGGVRVAVKQRENGKIIEVGTLVGRAYSDDYLELTWETPTGRSTTLVVTTR